MSLKILILGANGFIGSHLSQTIMKNTDWEVYGLDLDKDKLECLDNPRFHFHQANLLESEDWVEEHIQRCDIILPLVAIANPIIYVQDPLRVFELDFEANLKIVKLCVKYHKRIVFPSTSEVYGMATDEAFDEESTNLITGPINKERWIYSSSKQLLDRVIYAYGKHKGLNYTLFRPFNWVGPKLDKVFGQDAKHSRVLSKFLSNIVNGENIELVGGGEQRRCFIYIDDAINALMRIIENKNNIANNQIFNIGNPDNDLSIKELADKTLAIAKQFPKYSDKANKVKVLVTDAEQFYGTGYQDVTTRRPSIQKAKDLLDWEPSTSTAQMLQRTVEYYLS